MRIGILLPIVLVELVLLIVALVDCIRARDTNGPKWLWILVTVLFGFIGPIAYFLFGRKNR